MISLPYACALIKISVLKCKCSESTTDSDTFIQLWLSPFPVFESAGKLNSRRRDLSSHSSY